MLHEARSHAGRGAKGTGRSCRDTERHDTDTQGYRDVEAKTQTQTQIQRQRQMPNGLPKLRRTTIDERVDGGRVSTCSFDTYGHVAYEYPVRMYVCSTEQCMGVVNVSLQCMHARL